MNDFRLYHSALSLSDELYHFGILGMKWGVRRFQNPDGTLTPLGRERYTRNILNRSFARSLNSWGTSKDKNILYITGLSGSGKSTVSDYFKDRDPNTNVIHLDYYFEKGNPEEDKKYQDADFNKYLKSKNFDINDLHNKKNFGTFEKHLKAFGEKQYGKKKVIVEGIQLADDSLMPDKKFFIDKPHIVSGIDAFKSNLRGAKRDGISLLDFETNKIRKQNQKVWNNHINKLLHDAGAMDLGRQNVDKIMNNNSELKRRMNKYLDNLEYRNSPGLYQLIRIGYPLLPTMIVGDKAYIGKSTIENRMRQHI